MMPMNILWILWSEKRVRCTAPWRVRSCSLCKAFALALLAALLVIFPCHARDGLAPEFTAEERDFLATHPRMRVGVGLNFPPFQYVDEEKTGLVFKGMVSDYLTLLGERLGIELSPVMDISFEEALERGRRGEMDVYACIAETPERAEFLLFTKPYLEYPLVIIARDDSPFIGSIRDLQGKRVAITKPLVHYNLFLKHYPDLDVRFVFQADVPSEVAAVALGKADACVANLAVVSYLIKKNGWSNLRVAAPTPWKSNPLAMAVRADWPLLREILQKALDGIPPAEHDAISQHWIQLKLDQGLNWSALLRVLLPLAAAVTALMLFILAWNRRLMREIRRRKRAQQDLRAAEETYRNVFLNAQVGMFRTDIQTGMVLDANDAVARFVGYRDREEMLAAPFSMAERYVNPGDREKMTALLKAGREFTDFEAPFRRNDGTTILMRFSARLVPDKGWIEGVSVDVTRERQAQEALRESEDRLRVVTNATTDLLYEWEIANDRLEWFGPIDAVLGYEPGEIEQTIQAWAALIHPEDAARLADSVERHRTSVEPICETYRVRRRDGAWVWWEDMGTPTLDADGRPAKWIGSCTDITSRKRAEEELRFLGAITANMSDSIVATDTQFRIHYINHRAEQLYGYTIEELRGQTPDLFNAEPMAGEIQEEIYRRVSAGEIFQAESLNRRKDGSTFICEYKVTPLLDDQDKVHAYVGIQRDVTEAYRQREALRESEEKWRAIVTASPDGNVIAGMDMVIRYVSQKTIEMVGHREAEEICGRSLMEFVDAGDQGKAADLIGEMLKGHYSGASEYRIIRGDGTRVSVEINGEVLRNADGVAEQMFFTLRDITERKRAEEALREKLAELERMNHLMVGRENRMIELKAEVNELCRQGNLPERYAVPHQLVAELQQDKP